MGAEESDSSTRTGGENRRRLSDQTGALSGEEGMGTTPNPKLY